MEWFIAFGILNVIGIGYVGRMVRKVLNRPQTNALPAEPRNAHTLVKTWIELGGDGVIKGWRAKCSCGSISYATDATREKPGKPATYGTEENVINAFELHANLFNRANGNVWKDKHDELQKNFDAAQEKCYCKDISPVQLIALRD